MDITRTRPQSAGDGDGEPPTDVHIALDRCVCTHAHGGLLTCVLQYVLLAKQCIPSVIHQILHEVEDSATTGASVSLSRMKFAKAFTQLEQCMRESFASGRRGGVRQAALAIGQSELLYTDLYRVHLPPAHCGGLADDGCGLRAPPETLSAKERQRVSLSLYRSPLCRHSRPSAPPKRSMRARLYLLARRSADLRAVAGLTERPDVDFADAALLRRRRVNVAVLRLTHGELCEAVGGGREDTVEEDGLCWYSFDHVFDPVID